MPKKQIKHLIKMVNQIALNFNATGDEDDVVRQTAEHLKKFWSPSMIKQLTDSVAQERENLSPIALKTLANLQSGLAE